MNDQSQRDEQGRGDSGEEKTTEDPNKSDE